MNGLKLPKISSKKNTLIVTKTMSHLQLLAATSGEYQSPTAMVGS
jgi:hypothetical protein